MSKQRQQQLAGLITEFVNPNDWRDASDETKQGIVDANKKTRASIDAKIGFANKVAKELGKDPILGNGTWVLNGMAVRGAYTSEYSSRIAINISKNRGNGVTNFDSQPDRRFIAFLTLVDANTFEVEIEYMRKIIKTIKTNRDPSSIARKIIDAIDDKIAAVEAKYGNDLNH